MQLIRYICGQGNKQVSTMMHTCMMHAVLRSASAVHMFYLMHASCGLTVHDGGQEVDMHGCSKT
jgi:hypothetical protein